DGTSGTVESHVYNTNGTYTATATVRDSTGATGTSSTVVTAGTGGGGGGGTTNQPPVFSAPLQAWPSTASVGQKVLFTFSVSDPNGAPVTASYNYGDGSTGYVESHAFNATGSYNVVVTANDGKGGITTSQTTVTVK